LQDCWPIENVAKVSVISGEFWGYSVPMLWSMATNYFIVTVIFDLAGGEHPKALNLQTRNPIPWRLLLRDVAWI
jgi:hypothetical protein